jgi:intein/homing endonuclease
MSNFTKYDEEMLQIIRDPVKWAEHHLGEKPRWYQEQILRHPHHRKVLRCGRRIGKCIEETQRVMNPVTGEYKTVRELFEQQKDGEQPALLTLNEEYKLEGSNAFFVEDNGIKEAFEVVTKHGAKVILTGNHPVLTVDGWVEVDALKIGQSIATPKSLNHFGETIIDGDQLRLIAYLLGAGQFNKKSVTFQLRYPELREVFMDVATANGIRVREMTERTLKILNPEDIPYFEDIVKRKIPSIIYMLTKEQLGAFLGHLYAVGGWFFAKRIGEIGFATRNKQFALDIKHLLLRFGIQVNLLQKTLDGHEYFHLMMYHRSSILLFLEFCAIYAPERSEEYAKMNLKAQEMNSSDPVIPKDVWKYLEAERKDKGMKKSEVAGGKDRRLRTNKGITLSNARIYAENLQSAMLWDFIHSDILWEEVIDIIPLGKRQTYDVFVPETHNLVVEDILVHNTWTMTAHMLWVAFTCNGGTETKKGATCIVATPYDNQARLIFDQLKIFIDNNPVLENSIKSMTKNPYVIEFKNKSIIRLFTAGTRSGSEGGSLRGQKASWLYMDEVDYMTDKDFEAIYAITFEAPKRIGVMVASTPTGKRGMFYKLCTQMRMNQTVDMNDKNFYDMRTYDRNEAEGWQEFYYPTMVNPEWDEKMERELKQQFSEVAYEHEVLAEFGTEMVGVYNKDYVDEAAGNGYVLHSTRQHAGPITIGIDWDKFGAATQIVVTQWNPYDRRRPRPEMGIDEPGMGRFQVINRIEIAKGDFTYDNAVKKIVELDGIYNPIAIYPDRGAGEYQIEMLRKHLGDKVKGIHLGGSHMVRDPYSREFDKKPIKPFMVNQSVLMMERGMLRIPNRGIDETIARQMTNYQVQRISPKTGEPTYSSGDEHALDAMNLSLLAFIIERPDIAQTVEHVAAATAVASAKLQFVDPLQAIASSKQNFAGFGQQQATTEWDEPTPRPPRKTNIGVKKHAGASFSWGSRGSSSRKMPSRGSW